jgi:hypothetical protein
LNCMIAPKMNNQAYDGSDLDDEEYEPTEQEIIGYAEFLGMDLDEDRDLLYIAEEGVSVCQSYFVA